MSHPLTSRPARAIYWTVALALLVAFVPGIDALRWWPEDATTFVPRVFRPTPETAVADTPIEGEPAELDDEAVLALADQWAAAPAPPPAPPPAAPAAPAEPLAVGAPASDDGAEVSSKIVLPPPPEVRMTEAGIPLLPIEDPQGSLRRFYAALARTAGGADGGLTRVLHYGDSLIGGDYVTQTVRRLMQKRFGDGGHGFVLAGKPWAWYRRENLKFATSDDWKVWRLTVPTIRDGMYGLGGATFAAKAGGEWLRYEPAGPDLGRSDSRFQVYYLAQPAGGEFQMQAGDRELVVSTAHTERAERIAEIVVPDGPHVFRVRTAGNGPVRLFGVVLERDGPGVVYDSLGINGARAKLLERYDADHWHAQIRMRRPDLLVLHFGTNESQEEQMGAKRYREDLTKIVGRIRLALPGVSCLLVAPIDRADRHESGALVTRPVVKRIVQVQREVAYAQGCAFWNTWQAMGGEGSMARWMRMNPPLGGGDLTHPTPRGADRVGAMLFAALMDGFTRSQGVAGR